MLAYIAIADRNAVLAAYKGAIANVGHHQFTTSQFTILKAKPHK